MSEQQLPHGWDKQQMQQWLAEVENRTEEEWIADDEAAKEPIDDQTIITMPTELLPEIRRLFAKDAAEHAEQSDHEERVGTPRPVRHRSRPEADSIDPI